MLSRKASSLRYRSQHTRNPAAIIAETPADTRAVESSVTGSRSSGVSPKIRYESSATTNGKLSRSSSFGASALSIAVRATVTGTEKSSTVATAAAARRVVKLETAIDSEA